MNNKIIWQTVRKPDPMHYVQAFDRDQFMMTTWDSMVNPERLEREFIEDKRQEARERLGKYDGYQRIMDCWIPHLKESGKNQKGL